MNDYRFPGNDPNRQREIQSPEEVRRMMTGGEDDKEMESLLERSYGRGRTISETLETEAAERCEIISLVPVLSSETYERAQSHRPQDSCVPCGRAFDCCCQGCTICPQTKMGPGMVSAAWARKMNLWSGTDPREEVL